MRTRSSLNKIIALAVTLLCLAGLGGAGDTGHRVGGLMSTRNCIVFIA